MKDFLDFDLNLLYYGTEATSIGRIVDRLLFNDYPREHHRLLNDIRFLRMSYFYYRHENKELLSIDDELKKSFISTIDHIEYLLRFHEEKNMKVDSDISFLVRLKNQFKN